MAEMRMAVTVTLVFSDEAHREAWLLEQRIIPPASAAFFRNDTERRETARRRDYNQRMSSQNLVYTVGPVRTAPHCVCPDGNHVETCPLNPVTRAKTLGEIRTVTFPAEGNPGALLAALGGYADDEPLPGGVVTVPASLLAQAKEAAALWGQ